LIKRFTGHAFIASMAIFSLDCAMSVSTSVSGGGAGDTTCTSTEVSAAGRVSWS